MKKTFIIRHIIFLLIFIYLAYIGFNAGTFSDNYDPRPGNTIFLIGIAGIGYEIYVYKKNTGTDRWY